MNPIELLLPLLSKQLVAFDIGTVKSIDETENTCIVEREGKPPLFDVRFQAVTGAKDILFIRPVVGSYVLISTMAEGNVIVMYSDIESVSFIIGDTSIFFNKDGLVFDNGDNGGLAKISELVDKLNNIEESINELKQCCQKWAPVPQDGGNALKTSLSSWAVKTIQKTTIDDLENKRIKQ